MTLSPKLRAWLREVVQRLLAAVQRLCLPGPSVLPVAGAVVGVYSGLAAGLFANLIGPVRGASYGIPLLVDTFRSGSETRLLPGWPRQGSVARAPIRRHGAALNER